MTPKPGPGDDTPAGYAAKKNAGEWLKYESLAPYEALLLKYTFINCCRDPASTHRMEYALDVFIRAVRNHHK